MEFDKIKKSSTSIIEDEEKIEKEMENKNQNQNQNEIENENSILKFLYNNIDNNNNNESDSKEKFINSDIFKSCNFNIKIEELNFLFNKIHKEILFFSQIITGALIRFYNILNSCSNKILEIFNQKIKDILIRNELYRIIYDIKAALSTKRQNIFSKNLLKLYDLKPYCMSINPYLCMDNDFKEIVKKNAKKNYSLNSNIILFKEKEEKEEINLYLKSEKENNNDYDYDFDKDNLNLNINNNDIIKNNIYSIKNKINYLNNLPYEKTLFLLRKFNQCKSIQKKIDLIFLLRESILIEIDIFWKDIPIKVNCRSVDADNILSIFVYLIMKCQMSNLYIDIEIMDCFLSKNIKLTRKGYFFSLIQSSIEYIIDNINKVQIDENIKEYNKKVIKEIEKLKISPQEIFDFINFKPI